MIAAATKSIRQRTNASQSFCSIMRFTIILFLLTGLSLPAVEGVMWLTTLICRAIYGNVPQCYMDSSLTDPLYATTTTTTTNTELS
jgi:hypothetical protein